MYFKLSLRNMRRSASDYAIYFITIMLAISLMFAFNSIIFSEELISLAENMTSLTYSLIILSVILVIVLAFMVNYATKFIIKKRKREFGTYLLLGMERRKVSRMFLIENICIGILSFAAGIVLGMVLFQLFSVIIMNIFDQVYRIQVVFSLKAVLLTAIYFVMMYVLALWGGGRLIAKLQIYDLIYGSKYNEDMTNKHPLLYTIYFLIYSGLCGGGIYGIRTLFTDKISTNADRLTLFGCLLAVVIGVYGIYKCLASFINLLQSKMKHFRYHHTNLFLLRQITSKIQTNSRVMAVLAVLLTLSLCLLTMGLSFSQVVKSSTNSDTPFDVMVTIKSPDVESFSKVIDFIDAKAPVKDAVEYKLYAYKQAGYGEVAFLKLSDYNRLREQLGLDQKQLSNGQFIIHAESWTVREDIQKKMNNQLALQIGETRLTSDATLMFSEPIEQYQTNAFDEFTFVVPDSLADASLTPVRSILIATNETPAPASLLPELKNFIHNDWLPTQGLQWRTPDDRPRIMVKSWTQANSMVAQTTFSFGSLYISFVFFLIVATVLSMHQLTDSAEHKFRFDLLRKLGVGNSEIDRLALKQLALYFVFPVIVPIIVTVAMSFIMNQFFSALIPVKNIIFNYMLIGIGSFLILYLCFFIATYIGFKRNIAAR